MPGIEPGSDSWKESTVPSVQCLQAQLDKLLNTK